MTPGKPKERAINYKRILRARIQVQLAKGWDERRAIAAARRVKMHAANKAWRDKQLAQNKPQTTVSQ